MSQPLCRVCGAKASQQCGQCSISLYCGQECANTDWEHGHHARICSDADDLHTEALPLARRLFMESSLPTVHPEDRAEALELVDSLLMEHCAEEFFMENPHLIDEYLSNQEEEDDEELIGAGLDAGIPLDEEDHLLNDLAEIRGEALAWLDDLHVRDAKDYHMIGAEFGQHAQHWQEEYERVENKFTDFLRRAGQAVKRGARKVAKGAKKAADKAKKLAGKARDAIRSGAKSAAARLRGARLRGARDNLKSRVLTKKRAISSKRARRRAEKKGMFKTRRNQPVEPMISRASLRRSRSAERKAQKAQEKATLDDYQRKLTQQREEYHRKAQEDAAQNKDYLEQQPQIEYEEERRRRELDAEKAKRAAQKAAKDPDSPRLKDKLAAQRRAGEEQRAAAAATVVSQGQPQVPGVSPTVVVVPQAVALVPTPPTTTMSAPRDDVQNKRNSLNQKAMNLEQQQRYYQEEIRKLEERISRNQQTKAQLEQKSAAPSASEIEKQDWDSEMRQLVGRIEMDTQTMKKTQQKVAAAQVQREQIVLKLQQLPFATSTCISWK